MNPRVQVLAASAALVLSGAVPAVPAAAAPGRLDAVDLGCSPSVLGRDGCRVLTSLHAVASRDPSGLNAFSLAQQSDGNVVERNGQGRALWSTGTAGHPGAHLVMQTDGNAVIRDAAGRAVWNTGTAGHPGATLTLQTDSNVVVRDAGGRALWSSGIHR